MPLHFRNDTGKTIWVAIAYRDDRCTGSKWRKEGWWKIGPRSSKMVYSESAKDKTFSFFAHDEGYNHTWPKRVDAYTDLPDHIFDRCWDEPGGERRGMGDFRSHARDYTMELYF